MKEVVDKILEQVEADILKSTSTAMILSKPLFQWYISCKQFLMI